MRGVTVQLASAVAHGFISTRTPHAGSDGEFAVGALDRFIISTRTPHAGSDAEVAAARNGDNKFQPALPMRGVTGHRVCMHESVSISTRTPHAGSDIVFAAHITH